MKLFISYSRDDAAYVYPLAQKLQENIRHQVWIDIQIEGSTDWWESILKAVEWCDVCIFIMSPKSVSSIYCDAEISYVRDWNKPLVPLLHKLCTVPDVITKNRIQYIDITKMYDLGKVVIEIENALLAVREEKLEGKYVTPNPAPTRPNAPQPPTPVPTGATPIQLFRQAAKAAQEGNLAEAERLYEQVKALDPDGYGIEATEKLTKIRQEMKWAGEYQEIINMFTEGMIQDAMDAYRVFLRKQNGGRYDPLGYHDRLTQSSPPVVVLPPKPKLGRIDPATHKIVERTDEFGVVQVWVPPGEFLMGSTEEQVAAAIAQAKAEGRDPGDWYRNELPQHLVVIENGFWLDKTPVTNASYEMFTGKGAGYTTKEYWTVAGWEWRQDKKRTGPTQYNGFLDPQQPRVGVYWYEAMAYAAWRNGRLPTESEWEYAARSSDGRIYPWGNTFDPNYAVYSKTANGKTALVGSKPAGRSWVGALDMAGKVWEWCLTAYDQDQFPYPYREDDGRNVAVI
jgi:formylglycine-generating enzyme required for sulfatase activity